jgi:polyisoprenoid-binding protein YceI
MKKLVILGLAAMPLFLVSCGGGEAEAEAPAADSTVVETVVSNYTVDSATTVINWNNFNADTVSHMGTAKVLSGSIDISATGDSVVLTGGSLEVNMNSITGGDAMLDGHLKTADFFDVNQFATSTFTFEKYEGGMVYGKVSIIGKEVPVEAPITITQNEQTCTIEVGSFTIDFAQIMMPFFEKEKVKAPKEGPHDTKIAFTATIQGTLVPAAPAADAAASH